MPARIGQYLNFWGGDEQAIQQLVKMIPILVEAGHRTVVPDLVGFGRSDKPADRKDYTYQRHVVWMHAVVAKLALNHNTLVGQDWGGLIGLRLVAEKPDIFDRVVAVPMPVWIYRNFMSWLKNFSRPKRRKLTILNFKFYWYAGTKGLFLWRKK